MSMTCAQYREAIVPLLRGELEALARARIESHLGHCQGCARLRRELDAGLSAARAWEPTLQPAQLERLVGRLSPYTEARPTTSRWVWALAAATLLLAVATVLTLRTTPPATPSLVSEPAPAVAPVATTLPLLQQQPSPYVRLLSSPDWDGQVSTAGRTTEVTLRRGFVAVAFRGGKGRSLRLHAGPLEVVVVGTRFVVERDAAGVFVAVAEGTVRLRVGDRSWLLPPGAPRELLADGTVRPATTRRPCEEAMAQEYLTALAAPTTTRPRPAPAELTGEDVTEQLARAEELVSAAQLDAAETIYAACVDDPDDAYDPFRDLCRLHLARLLGLARGRLDEARQLLQGLGRAAWGEVGREASLTECELDLKARPCDAKACLERLARAVEDEPELSREAQRLLHRWGLATRSCE